MAVPSDRQAGCIPTSELYKALIIPIQNNLAALARHHRVEPLLEVSVVETMRNDGRDIESAL